MKYSADFRRFDLAARLPSHILVPHVFVLLWDALAPSLSDAPARGGLLLLRRTHSLARPREQLLQTVERPLFGRERTVRFGNPHWNSCRSGLPSL
jgi:hypothetical protein